MMLTRSMRCVAVFCLLSLHGGGGGGGGGGSLVSTAMVTEKFPSHQGPAVHRQSTTIFMSQKRRQNGEDIHHDDGELSSDSKRRSVVIDSMSAIGAATAAMTAFPTVTAAAAEKSRNDGYAIQFSDLEWKSKLSPTQYFILRQGGTERPNSSILESEERDGLYACAGCKTPLFDSSQKFHSGTGWPSFAKGLEGVEVENMNPIAFQFAGAELRCKDCGGHLGDVFGDGKLFLGTPAFDTGKRYCIDGAALVFVPNDDPSNPVAGDLAPPKSKMPSWLEPPPINAQR